MRDEPQHALGRAEVLLRASAHSDVGTQGQARHRNADEEHDKQKEGIVEAIPREGAAARQCPPQGEARENDGEGRGRALVASQRCPQQRQDRQEPQRIAVCRLPNERAVCNDTNSDRRRHDCARRAQLEAPEGLRIDCGP